MRIIAGKYRSRLIYSPRGVELRPTADRVKESLFGILGAAMIDKAVLDLYSGTGNLGIEALSRGAASCVFVDNNPRCVSAIKQNLRALNIDEGTEVILKDVSRYIKEATAKGARFDIIFLDPPYYKDTVKKSLLLLDYYNIITNHSIIVAEHYKRDELPGEEELKSLKLFRQEKYGGTFLSFYK
jgi:16S rRNA (guanine(966)-N(2))-methyltransferase RsmD